MACPGTAFNVVWQVTTSHDAQAKPTAAIEEAEHVTDTTTNPTDGTPTDSNDSPTTTLLRHSQAVTDKTAPTLSILQNGTTASMPLATGTSERTKRRKELNAPERLLLQKRRSAGDHCKRSTVTRTARTRQRS